MNFRKHLRGWTTAWLACQLLTLSAFVPRDCCAAHTAHKAAPQAAAGDASCATQHGDHHAAAQPAPVQPSRSDCSLRGRCDGPMAVLLSVLSTQGVLADSPAVAPALDQASLTLPVRENLTTRFVPTDSPPPRG